MLSDSNRSDEIYKLLTDKACLKQKIFDNTLEVFRMIKEVSRELEDEYNSKLKEHDKRVMLRYRNAGTFQCELKVAGDLLVFNMHTNIFQFNREHKIWQHPYIRRDRNATYSGIISIYNFLADSFKYNRTEDVGYLIARIFINKDMFFFVEGKQQIAYLSSVFGNEKIDKSHVREILEAAILYALKFDLLVPPYDAVKVVSVEQILEQRKLGVPTGKRLGFSFNSDDIEGEKLLYSGG